VPTLSFYEQSVLREIEAWKHPTLGWFGKTLAAINRPLDKAGNVVLNAPHVGPAIEKTVAGLVTIANDAAQWSVRHGSIHEEYRQAGHDGVSAHADVARLDLEHVDRVIGFLAAKYKTAALLEGAATGAAGLPGIPADIIALVFLNLRAIGEYATYCGFDVSTQAERLFAMNVLGLASSPNDESKQVAMAELVRIAKDVAEKKVWKELEQNTFVAIIRRIAQSLGMRLTKAKLAESIPVAGAVIGGGFNAYFTAKVCDAAYFLYRERFLAEKYGADVITHIPSRT
jgi:EcsC protein family